MGISTIGGAGISLPPPQPLFPATVSNSPQLVGSNSVSLGPGGDILVPPGTWLISPGLYSQVQVLDPVSGTWRPYSTATVAEPISINSDGINYRVINPTGFPIGAIVTNGGTGFTAVPTVAASIGASTWQAIVGGSVGSINIVAASSGINFSVPPIVSIAAPPSPGVPASAVANISGGTITSFTIINPGAGYTSAPVVTIVPQNSDLNAMSTTVKVTNASALASLSGVGQITALLMTNEGSNPLSVAPALTFTGGGGSAAAATAVMAFTITGWSITTGGSAPPGAGGTFQMQTSGGAIQALTSGLTSPASSVVLGANLLIPRQAQIVAVVSGAGGTLSVLTGSAQAASSGIIDGGLFTTVPTIYAPGTNGVYAAVVGGASDTIFVQPL